MVLVVVISPSPLSLSLSFFFSLKKLTHETECEPCQPWNCLSSQWKGSCCVKAEEEEEEEEEEEV